MGAIKSMGEDFRLLAKIKNFCWRPTKLMNQDHYLWCGCTIIDRIWRHPLDERSL